MTYHAQKNLTLIVGGAANSYLGGHFGELIWLRYASQSEIGKHYYDNTARKSEWNAYLKTNYQLKKVNVYADIQVRQIGYNYLGMDQNFNDLVQLNQAVAFTFFNPKAGATWEFNDRSAMYTSYSVAHREPVRDDFIQSSANSRPKPERLDNVELGYRFRSKKGFFNANYFLMNYMNQLILTGEINDVGAYNRTNVDRSYRTGIELESGWMLTEKWNATGNVTLSQNKIQKFTEYVDNYDTYVQNMVEHSNTDIAFSPNLIAAAGLVYVPVKGLEFGLLAKYVGQQYLDNTSNEARKLEAYTTTNFTAAYSFSKWGLKEIKLSLLANNIFNAMYQNNGYTWGYIYGGKRITENYYYPQAGRNYLLRLSIGL